jgi:hypothetical protein
VRGKADDEIIPFLVSVMVRYGKIDKGGSPRVIVYRRGKEIEPFGTTETADDKILDRMHI